MSPLSFVIRAAGPRALVLAALGVLLPCSPVQAQELPVQEFALQNGMRFLVVVRKDEPQVAGGWVAHVGGANERPGITGISHLFEHMMFKGTPTIGTRDAQKDAELIAAQERVRDRIRGEELRLLRALRRGEVDDITQPEARTGALKELDVEFARLVKEQRDLLVKNDFSRIYTAQGGGGMNAFTNHDMTAYYIQVPRNKLELWFWMESERLLRPVFREFYAERDVVFEERRMRTESTPTGRLRESFNAMLWDAHPYAWPVVGWPSDIPAITKAQADAYYATYYAPNNLTAALVGDVSPAEVRRLAEKYFGRLRRGAVPPPEVLTLEPRKEGERRFLAEAPTNPQVEVVWPAVPFQHRDSYAMELLADVLNGRSGRLHRALVRTGLSPGAGAHQDNRKYGGTFHVSAECKEGHTPDEIEKTLHREIDRLRDQPVPAEELQKVKNQNLAAAYRRLSSNMPILMQLIYSDGLGDWREVNQEPQRLAAVTAEDVQRVARRYLIRDGRAVAVFTRKAGGAK